MCYADEMGNCTVVLDNLHAAISVMEYYDDRDRLVIITKTLLMTQVHRTKAQHPPSNTNSHPLSPRFLGLLLGCSSR